jgi:type IV pilus assembly protein PilZ
MVLDARAQQRYDQSVMAASEPPPVGEERSAERLEVAWSVDCETEETFLYASITNISEMGIFIRTNEPLSVGTYMKLRFAPGRGEEPFVMGGCVQWVNLVHAFGENLNPGMGVKFVELSRDERERLVAAIRTIAYLRGDPAQLNQN